MKPHVAIVIASFANFGELCGLVCKVPVRSHEAVW